MTRHLSDGLLRRLVDEPAGVSDTDRAHAAACPRCADGLAAARHDAETARAALSDDEPTQPADDVDAAWVRLSATLGDPTAEATAPAVVVDLPSRRRTLLRRPVLAAVGAAIVVAGAGAAAANDWLPIFRTEQVAPVTISEADLVDLPDLSAYGDMEVVQPPEPRPVVDAAAAAAATGLTVPQVSALPQGVSGEPTFQVVDEVSGVFTFSTEKATASAAAAGDTLPTPPAGLDGSEVRLEAGPGLVAMWAEDGGVPGMVVTRAVAPTAFASGVEFATARDYLLSLPGIPADVAAQLRAFSDDGTLPLFLPAGPVTSTTADVNGAPGTVVTSQDGTMAGVIWVKDGVVTAVLGSLDADEVLDVARGLR